MSKGIFITGTDTDCGKTYIATLILKALRQDRVDAVGYKPICCGDRNDALNLCEASGGDIDVDRVNPVWMKTAAAPYVAAMFEKQKWTREGLLAGYRGLADDHHCVITEGAGGWLVPVEGMGFCIAELAMEIGDPVILVVGNRLGALNHTLLTVEAMRSRGVTPVGLIFNNLSDEMDTATITNKGIIEELCEIPVIMDVIHDQEEVAPEPFREIMGV